MNCNNVVRMLDIYYSKSKDGKTAQNLVFEYCSRNLEEVIQTTKKTPNARISIEQIKSFMKQILQGIAFVHK